MNASLRNPGTPQSPIARKDGIHNESTSRILIVDDDVHICRVVAKMLSTGGYDCQSANNALDAGKKLANNAYELILCDITMPGDSGLDLLAKTKTLYPDMAIVMLTGIDSPETAQLAFQTGAVGYLLKPFQKNELLIQVAAALQQRMLAIENRVYREQLELKVSQRTTELQTANIQLKNNEIALKAQARELKDMNTALEVLLKKSEEVKSELQKNLSANLQSVIYPYLRKIAGLGLSKQQKAYMELIESTLADMVSPIMRNFAGMNPGLTPAETEVAHLIKQGKRTKEIAAILNLSINTILTHRYRIRKKLGLLGKATSLYAALHAMQ